MATAYHSRQLHEMPPSPSSSASATPPSDQPPYKQGNRHSPPASAGPSSSRARRPLSPSSLRELDLSHTPDTMTRNPRFPAPPTGHDLMAMFPPAPPDTFPEMLPGATSGFFQRQERAFFAQAGKEIVRVRVEIDLPQGDVSDPKPRQQPPPNPASRSWPANASPSVLNAPHHSPVQAAPAPTLYPHPPNRPPQRGAPPAGNLFNGPPPHTSPSAPGMPPSAHPHPAPPHHQSSTGIRTPPQDQNAASAGAGSKADYPMDDYDGDEAWRRPMPYAERRRAGKHTRRVIVRT